MNAPVPDSEHLHGTAAAIAVTWADEHGEPAAAGGAVTVRVQTADGTDLVTAGSSTTSAGAGVYQRALTPAQTSNLNWLTATWTDASSGATRVTYHEIVGGFYFSLATAYAWDDALSSQAPELLRTRRTETENECELITSTAWAPRYRRISCSGNNQPSIVLDRAPVRTVRSVRVYSTPTSYTAFSTTELAALAARDDGTLVRTDGNIFDAGEANLVIEFEHGHERPPADLLDANLLRFKDRIGRKNSGVQQRATSWTSPDGGTLTLDQPEIYKTGFPDVDAVYSRYSRRNTLIAGRVFDYDPTRGSLFHGLRR